MDKLKAEAAKMCIRDRVSEAAGVASAAGLKLQTSMVVSIVLVLALTVASFFVYLSLIHISMPTAKLPQL